ncbi:MAG: outer membrane beta-barrel protein [Saprospiraceae bacterium]|nr:outer membrane beta-barrel protein [Saprospiraceae bacterium]
MLYLHWRKVILIALFSFIATEFFAQSRQHSYNYEGFRRKDHYFGLTLGYNQSGYKIEHGRTLRPGGVFRVNNSVSNGGLTLCMITNFKIGEYVDYRILPSISLSYRTLTFTPSAGGPIKEHKIESVFGEIPMIVRFTSAPYKDFRVFMLSGVKYSYDFASNSRSDKTRFELIRISPHDFQVELGVGMQFYMPFFIFSPEIKFSHGISNLLIYDTKLVESTLIDKLFSRSLTISLHFEG